MGQTVVQTAEAAAKSSAASATSAAASAQYAASMLEGVNGDKTAAELAQYYAEQAALSAQEARDLAQFHSENFTPGPVGPQGPVGPASTVPGPEGPEGKAMELVHHGSDPNVARPDSPAVYWLGTATPVNAAYWDFHLRENI